MKALFILNAGPYGSERSYNGLRLAGTLGKSSDNEIRVFLIGDAVTCAKAGQKVPQGFYNIELMVNKVVRSKGQVGLCGSCMDARAMATTEIIEGTQRSSMEALAQWTQWADKVIVF
jgi:uncharacterized protein involved in oxidation of intracellular sulfur